GDQRPPPFLRGRVGGGPAVHLRRHGAAERRLSVPAGTVRHQVMGRAERPAGPEERAAMTALVAQAVADGAVGLSTGLDDAPGLFADADEIAALCTPLAPAGLPYVTHMRGGYEENSQVGVEEAARIGRAAGVPVHISHFHT